MYVHANKREKKFFSVGLLFGPKWMKEAEWDSIYSSDGIQPHKFMIEDILQEVTGKEFVLT